MSDWYPHAVRRELPYAKHMPARQNSPTVVMHTNAGGAGQHGDLYKWFARTGNDVAAHFQVAWDGTTYQYVPISKQAYAQYAANPFAVSVETQDDGHPSKPWTPEQVASIVGICQWLEVPARVSPNGPGGGVGWHEQYDAWNRSGHACPGAVRERQITQTIIPELDMPSIDEIKAAIREVLAEELVTVPGETGEKPGTKRSLLTAATQQWGHLLRIEKRIK